MYSAIKPLILHPLREAVWTTRLKLARQLQQLNAQWKSEKGEVNMVAIVLIILVVLALVAIFRDSLTNLLKTLFEKIQNEALAI
ncbi:MAG: Flp1 family type IVb pilin [Peptoniphilaceae bacterium]|nr:Flp1 family type IVb pilin [Peptoniphilaceae bacterium]MDY6085863.1 Flp1 family type IVb pilin [Peptoniphilaceae bacterium]